MWSTPLSNEDGDGRFGGSSPCRSPVAARAEPGIVARDAASPAGEQLRGAPRNPWALLFQFRLSLQAKLLHLDLPIDQIKQGKVWLVIAGNADINGGEAHLIRRIVG